MKNSDIELTGKRIAWVMPAIEAGSGGLQTICRHISYLQSLGAVCDIIVCQFKFADSEEGIRKLMLEHYQCEPDTVFVSGFSPETYDAAIATLNSTVPFCRAVNAAHRLYFVQDYEPYFYAMGNGYLEAQQTYSAGLSIVTIGRWLAHKLYEEHGGEAWFTDFAADENIYHPLGLERKHAVCAIFQPEKDRRCPTLVLDALEIVHAVDPTLEIVLYGANGDYDLPGPGDFRGVVTKEECNQIYNECEVGLCISATNPSRIPFEMMAAGLPVVDIHRENTSWDFDPNCSLLADATPAALAEAILSIAGNPRYARSLGDAGAKFMEARANASEQKDFARALQEALSGVKPPKTQAISPELASKPPKGASDELMSLQEAFEGRKLKLKTAIPAVNCSVNYANLSISNLPCNGTHVGVYAIVIPATAKNRGRRFDAYGMDASGNVLLQIDFNRLERRSDLYSCELFVERDGKSTFVAECSIRGWFEDGDYTAPAGPFAYSNPLSRSERMISFEFSQTPFAGLASAAAFALLPAPVLDAVRPIAKIVLRR